MNKFMCCKCNKEFSKKQHLDNHENKKNPCKPKAEFKTEISPNFTKIHQITPKNEEIGVISKLDNFISEDSSKSCCFCNKSFVNDFTLKRHLDNRCKVKKLDEEKKENIFNILLEKEKIEKEMILTKLDEFQNKMGIILINNENLQKNNENLQKNYENLQKNNENLQKTNKFLQKKLNKFEDKLEEQNKKYDNKMKQIINKNINNKNSNNTNNYTQNNIIIPSDKLTEFGKEDLTKIDLKDLFQIIQNPRLTGTSIFIEMLKLIHFNPKLPQFQNVYLTDKNREKFMTWNGKKWGLNADCINKILSQFEDWKLLNEDDIEEAGKTGNYKRVVEKFIKFFDKCFFDDNDENKEDIKRNENFRESIEELIKEFLYNNRNTPIDNFEKIRNELMMTN